MTPEHPLAVLVGLAVAAVFLWPGMRRWRYTVSLGICAVATALAWALGAAGVFDEAPYKVVAGSLAVASFAILALEALSEAREGRDEGGGS